MSSFNSPFIAAIEHFSAISPDKCAVISESGERISYKRLYENIQKAAFWLHEKGIKKGDRILISGSKDLNFIYFYFASHVIGSINIILDPLGSEERNLYISSTVKPSLALGKSVDGIESLLYENINLSSLKYIRPDTFSNEILPEDTAEIIFTSGTTGRPKGVCLSFYNILSSAENINGFIGNDGSDVEFLGLPLCHSFGLGRLRCNLLNGASVVLHNGFANLKSVFDSFENYNVSGFGMVPAIFAYIKKLSGNRIGKFADKIKYIEIGSASMPSEDKILLCQLFPETKICMHYGLTEASRAVFTEFNSDHNFEIAGKPVNEKVSLKIFDNNGNSLDSYQEGEIGIKGNMVATSYFLEDDNEKCFKDGYFLTGDWGYLDSEGNLFLVGRKKEMINVGGKKVNPIEIENILGRLGVGECMCMAMPDPDGIMGEVPKVLLVKGSFSSDISYLKEKLKSELPLYKQPREFIIVNSIPKTDNGKKIRFNHV